MLRTERNNNDALLPYGSSVKRQKKVEVVCLLFLKWYFCSSHFLKSPSHECWNYDLLLHWTYLNNQHISYQNKFYTKCSQILELQIQRSNFIATFLCAAAIFNIRLWTPAWICAYWMKAQRHLQVNVQGSCKDIQHFKLCLCYL